MANVIIHPVFVSLPLKLDILDKAIANLFFFFHFLLYVLFANIWLFYFWKFRQTIYLRLLIHLNVLFRQAICIWYFLSGTADALADADSTSSASALGGLYREARDAYYRSDVQERPQQSRCISCLYSALGGGGQREDDRDRYVLDNVNYSMKLKHAHNDLANTSKTKKSAQKILYNTKKNIGKFRDIKKETPSTPKLKCIASQFCNYIFARFYFRIVYVVASFHSTEILQTKHHFVFISGLKFVYMENNWENIHDFGQSRFFSFNLISGILIMFVIITIIDRIIIRKEQMRIAIGIINRLIDTVIVPDTMIIGKVICIWFKYNANIGNVNCP